MNSDIFFSFKVFARVIFTLSMLHWVAIQSVEIDQKWSLLFFWCITSSNPQICKFCKVTILSSFVKLILRFKSRKHEQDDDYF
jgi:hypothetical protein